MLSLAILFAAFPQCSALNPGGVFRANVVIRNLQYWKTRQLAACRFFCAALEAFALAWLMKTTFDGVFAFSRSS